MTENILNLIEVNPKIMFGKPVIDALRTSGFDVLSVSETFPRAKDEMEQAEEVSGNYSSTPSQ